MSTDSRSVLIHQASALEAGQFDRFVLGATLAGCAYLGQTIPYGQVGYNVETMFLYSLLILACSAMLGFKRIEAGLNATKMNSKYLHHLEMRNPEAAYLCQLSMDTWVDKTSTFYRLRNLMLMLGFGCYIATKVFATYVK